MTRPPSRAPRSTFSPPFLKRISLLPEKVDPNQFPFNRLPFLANGDFSIEFTVPITFFVGENGSGKSTVLEAIAALCGFHAGGGSHAHQLYDNDDRSRSRLADALRPAWLPRVNKGFFFRSESFFNLATYLDDAGNPEKRGGGRVHEQSHGEAFLTIFSNDLSAEVRGIYLLDEPENALSPSRQLAFLRILRDLERSGNMQAIIATHSPILLSYPGATIYSFDGSAIQRTTLEETDHYRVTRAFLADPGKYLAEVFAD